MIPADKLDAVGRGVHDAFGVGTLDSVAPVTGGHTNSLVFRIGVRGSHYLLKIITRNEDPARHYANMRAAADAGVAPRVWHTNTEERISITDFVSARPLARAEALKRLPGVLRTLHATRPFDRAPFNTTCTFLLTAGPARHGFLQKFKSLDLLPAPAFDEFEAALGAIAAVYPYGDAEMVSCHNDLFKPDNILFDGDKSWFVDWEAAFLNDRYADIAVVTNQLVATDDEEAAFLAACLGSEATPYQRARLTIMRQLAHLFYTMAFLYTGAEGRPIDWNAPVPDPDAFQDRMWSGGVDLSAREDKIAFARVSWERFRREEATGRPRRARARHLHPR